MSRRKRTIERRTQLDSQFNNARVALFINYIMRSGKKAIAENIFYSALGIISKHAKENGIEPVDYFFKAVENIRPQVKMASRRVGGSTYQVPVEISPQVSQRLGMTWLIKGANNASGAKMVDKLARTIVDAFNNKGYAFDQKENMRKSAEANKAFAHFA